MLPPIQNSKAWAKFLFIVMLSFAMTFLMHSALLANEITIAQSTNAGSNNQFVDIRAINPRIALDIRYATTNNFTKRKLYRSARCILRTPVAQALSRVQSDLETQGLGLKVFDCYRPLSVQKFMWKIVPDSRFVANPANGSRHNRGAAVDLTLVDRAGKELPMPTGFDDFSERAGYSYKNLPQQVIKNRQTLRNAMAKRGFSALETEWWHFDGAGWQQYPISDISFDAIPKSSAIGVN